MNAGKSTTLLQSSYNYQERGMQTLLFAPDFDNRLGKPAIRSRIGVSQDAILFNAKVNLFDKVQKDLSIMENLRCVLLDEAQFLTKSQVVQLVRISKELNLPVLCYGLRSDFLGEPFPGSQYLLTWAEEIIEIKTICRCGAKATMNMRIDAKGNAVTLGSQVQIGGNESYISVCMKHFIEEVSLMKECIEEKEQERCLR